MPKVTVLDPRDLKTDDIVVHHDQFYEVGRIDEKVHLCTLTSSPVAFGGSLSFDSPQWADVRRPKGKKELAYIDAIQKRRERTMPRMHHDAVRLPGGEVHVQNWVSGMGGGAGQHHVHTPEEFATWSKDVDPKYLTMRTDDPKYPYKNNPLRFEDVALACATRWCVTEKAALKYLTRYFDDPGLALSTLGPNLKAQRAPDAFWESL